MTSLNLVIGPAAFQGPEALKPALEAIKAAGIKHLDSAQMYGTNEADLGAVNASSMGFVISTKSFGGWKPGEALQRANLLQATKESLAKIGVEQVDIFYIHGPDRTMKLEEWVPTIDEIYQGGAFRRFGVSNFSPEEVRQLWDYCKEKGFVLPTVYQGNYNAVSRQIETTLFPVLRELGIAFYAYSPIAGGFLTKTRKQIEEGTDSGRFTADPSNGLAAMYRGMYAKPALLDALGKWEALAELQDAPKAELAYRWVYYHSSIKPTLGDYVIIGASKIPQISQTVEGLQKGPLKAEVAKGIAEIWDSIKNDALVDNFEWSQTSSK